MSYICGQKRRKWVARVSRKTETRISPIAIFAPVANVEKSNIYVDVCQTKCISFLPCPYQTKRKHLIYNLNIGFRNTLQSEREPNQVLGGKKKYKKRKAKIEREKKKRTYSVQTIRLLMAGIWKHMKCPILNMSLAELHIWIDFHSNKATIRILFLLTDSLTYSIYYLPPPIVAPHPIVSIYST